MSNQKALSTRKEAVRKKPKPVKRGRPAGAKSLIPKTLQAQIIEAAKIAGQRRVESLVEWAKQQKRELTDAEKLAVEHGGVVAYLTSVAQSDEKAFMSLLGKIIPREVNLVVEEDTLRLVQRAMEGHRDREKRIEDLRKNFEPRIVKGGKSA